MLILKGKTVAASSLHQLEHERTGEFTQTQEELGDGGERNHHEYKYRQRELKALFHPLREREEWKPVICSPATLTQVKMPKSQSDCGVFNTNTRVLVCASLL
ncbi:hypothetical protein Q8A67_025043 [Cirrhinus molitorella]|uniref:Uncharacterized protein n=1 Tax=Cirrhinus molitorella TaxID=172907 RepID=A0AA88NTV5_9TELE|nr:hypothetical protein Q8A67_025043 [Cirrhinus molitorella]